MPPPNRSRTVVWKPLVVCPQPDFQRRMHAVLTELAVDQPCTLTEYPRSGTIAALVERHACNICFLDAATNSEEAQLLISELAPAVPVVALHPRHQRGGSATASLRPSAGGARGGAAPAQRCEPNSARPAPRRRQRRIRSASL